MQLLKQIAHELGQPFHMDKYRMWNKVPFIGDTAIVIDETVIYGGQGLMRYTDEKLKGKITKSYITKAVKEEAISLGSFCFTSKSMIREFVPYWKRKELPSGYFTHKIGKDA